MRKPLIGMRLANCINIVEAESMCYRRFLWVRHGRNKDVSGQIHEPQVYFSIVTSSVKYILIYFKQYFDMKRYTKFPTLYHKGQLTNALGTFSLNRTQ